MGERKKASPEVKREGDRGEGELGGEEKDDTEAESYFKPQELWQGETQLPWPFTT